MISKAEKARDVSVEKIVPGQIGRKMLRFLRAYAKYGTINDASRASRIDDNTHYRWMKKSPDYAAEFAKAEERHVQLLEAAATSRAVDGVLEPIFQGGVHVGDKRKYSDPLLIRLLEAKHRKFAKKVQHEHSGQVNHAHIDLTGLTQAQLMALPRLVESQPSEAKPPQ